MKQGKLQLGDEAVPVQYELQIERNNRRQIRGRLTIMGQTPGLPRLSKALKDMTGANLITEGGQPIHVEFTNNLNGKDIEFIAALPEGFVL